MQVLGSINTFGDTHKSQLCLRLAPLIQHQARSTAQSTRGRSGEQVCTISVGRHHVLHYKYSQAHKNVYQHSRSDRLGDQMRRLMSSSYAGREAWDRRTDSIQAQRVGRLCDDFRAKQRAQWYRQQPPVLAVVFQLPPRPHGILRRRAGAWDL